MSHGRELFLGAQVSLAAYANLTKGITTTAENTDSLLEEVELPLFGIIPAAFIEAARVRFIGDFSEVLHRTHDEDTGFGATVFQLAEGGLSIAFRGTDDPRIDIDDIIEADLQIYSVGAAFDQIVTLYNWWQRVSVAPGTDPQNPVLVPQFKMPVWEHISGRPDPDTGFLLGTRDSQGGPSGFFLDWDTPLAPYSTEEGNIAAALATANGNVFAAGHSLGAHLAVAFATLFPTVTSDAYGFNTPGFKSNSMIDNFFNLLGSTPSVRIFSH